MLVVHQDLDDSQLPAMVGVLRIDDTRRGLIRLASAYRDELRGTRVIAVTGSAGKTTTRRLIHQILSTTLRGSEAPRSFNNDIGVPLTLLAARPTDDYVVLEIGTNAPGEIAALAAVAKPDIAVIVSIGRAHLEKLGSIEGVAREKAALLDGLKADGVAIASADTPLLRPRLATVQRCTLFGRAPDADLRLTSRGQNDQGWWFEINGSQRYRIGLSGEHNAVNALAAVAVARHMGVPDLGIEKALAAAQPPPMRMVRQAIGPIELHNDAYNANPESMRASLAAFVETTVDASRRVIILGDMLELGPQAAALHHELGEHLVDLDRRSPIALAILMGPMMTHAAEHLARRWPTDRVMIVPQLDDRSASIVADAIRPGDHVLLKASRSMALERLIVHLQRRFEQPSSPLTPGPAKQQLTGRSGCTVT